MDDKLFTSLVRSIEQAKSIASGKTPASRHFIVTAEDVKAIRETTGLSQDDFARTIHVSIKTLQNWEQRRRAPTGPAAALLKILAHAPDMAIRALNSAK